MKTVTLKDLSGSKFQADPFSALKPLRQLGPVLPAKIPILGHCYIITTHTAAAAMLKDSDTFVREPQNAGLSRHSFIRWWMPKSLLMLSENMLSRDEPEHKRLRSLVDHAFQRRGIESLSPAIERIADQLIDRMIASGSGDIVSDFARDLPLLVICELLGLPPQQHEQYKQWMASLTTVTGPWGIIRAIPGMRKLIKHLRQEFSHASGPGLISELVNANQDGQQLDEDELLSMVFLLFVAGHETTTHLISGGLHALLTHPEQRGQLTGDMSLMPLAVEEMLRFVTPVQMTKHRYAARDIDFFGQTIRRGQAITASIAAANGDPEKFDQPNRFIITRKPNPHLSFSTGIHFCLGFQLARLETRIAFEKLLTRLPNLQLACDENDIRWNARIGLRSLQSLPVKTA